MTGPSSTLAGAMHEPAVAPEPPAVLSQYHTSKVGAVVPPVGNVVPAARIGIAIPEDKPADSPVNEIMPPHPSTIFPYAITFP